MTLYEHKPHDHTPHNVNDVHKETRSLNDRIAVALTSAVGSMWTAYAFVILALLGFPALSVWLGPLVAIYVVWLSQCFIQLVMLPVLSVGQRVLGRHQELQADEQFAATTQIYQDAEQLRLHLERQDIELTKHTALLETLIANTAPHTSEYTDPS